MTGNVAVSAGAQISRYSLTLQIANGQSPTMGEVRGQIQGAISNLLGVGDLLALQYGRSQGINDGAASYSLPIAPDDTRVSLRDSTLELRVPVGRVPVPLLGGNLLQDCGLHFRAAAAVF